MIFHRPQDHSEDEAEEEGQCRRHHHAGAQEDRQLGDATQSLNPIAESGHAEGAASEDDL